MSERERERERERLTGERERALLKDAHHFDDSSLNVIVCALSGNVAGFSNLINVSTSVALTSAAVTV